jgi:hypothetical protein
MNAFKTGLAAAALLSSSLALAQTPPAEATAPAAAPVPAAPAADAATPAPKLSYTDDYRISVDDDANSDGEIVFRMTWKDGGSKDVTVPIKKGTNENEIARTIKKAFVDQIGTKKYNIEMEDGENVIIERSGGKGDTSLVLVSNSVKNVDVKVHWD